jgi:ADP-ribosylglycohydrolase
LLQLGPAVAVRVLRRIRQCVDVCAVNLGDDADTTAAVFGQLAGAYHRGSGIPEEWRNKIVMRELIEASAERLLTAKVH